MFLFLNICNGDFDILHRLPEMKLLLVYVVTFILIKSLSVTPTQISIKTLFITISLELLYQLIILKLLL